MELGRLKNIDNSLDKKNWTNGWKKSSEKVMETINLRKKESLLFSHWIKELKLSNWDTVGVKSADYFWNILVKSWKEEYQTLLAEYIKLIDQLVEDYNLK